MMSKPPKIGRARPAELPLLMDIEDRAGEIFPESFLIDDLPARTESVEELLIAQREGRILVARAEDDRVMGFALVESLGPDGLLEELDVDPRDGRAADM